MKIELSTRQARYLRDLQRAKHIAQVQWETALQAIAEGADTDFESVNFDLGDKPCLTLVQAETEDG